MKKRNFFGKIAVCIAVAMAVFFGVSGDAFADGGYGVGVSPMKQKIILNAGESYNGSFVITNPAANTENFDYIIKISPFYVTEDYNALYEKTGDANQIVDWITLKNDSGTLAPNSTKEIKFTINVPERAPAGGQYAALIVQAKPVEENNNITEGTGISINQTIGIAHTIYAEITGTATERKGEIMSAEVPGFLFSGNIVGKSAIKNTGNVHGTAKYTLKVFPLFSDEEVYTNEENPDELYILPDRMRYNETVWTNTPSMGIFNVVYTVEFEGIMTEVSKMVIICPLWLLFIIFFAIVSIAIWLVTRSKARKNGNGGSDSANRRKIEVE